MSDPDYDNSDLEQRKLCANCIGEPYLKVEVEHLGETEKCHYCSNSGPSLSLEEIADYVDMAFEQHFRRTPTEPSSLEYAMMKEGDYDWEREGEPAVYAIGAAAEIEEEPAEDIRRVLEERYFDIEMAKMGEEAPFDEESHYEANEPDDIEYRENWRYFERSLKTEARFFSDVAKAMLDDIFEGLADHRSPEGKPVIVDAGPETEVAVLYRARVFQSSPTLKEALKRPELTIGPPPAVMAKAGRMNAHGISVFYAATDSDTAISEVRPPVGSRVVVGKFVLQRKVNLLDVSALRSVYIEGSVFDATYIGRLERAKFLEYLSERISRPVMPDDEPLEYLVTQVIADYLASRSDPSLDGILYPSVQDSANTTNVMLFHKASRVRPFEFSDGTEIDVWTGHHTEDGWETDYNVIEKTPPRQKDPEEKREDGFPSFETILSPSAMFTYDYDAREPTLQLKSESLEVRHVTAARYDSDVHRVRRHRMEKQQDPF